MKSQNVSAVILGVLAILWALGMIYVVSHAANKMIGFHPLILFAIPIWGLIGVVSIFMAFTRLRNTGIVGVAGAAMIGVLLWRMHFIWTWSYDYHVWRTQNENLPAMESMTAFPVSDPRAFIEGLYDSTNLQPVIGFTWYDKSQMTAPNGMFYGLNVNGVPHVRVEKVRHGWLGLALSDSNPSNALNKLRSAIKYRPTRNPRIWIWDTGG